MTQPKHMKNKEKKAYKKVILFFIIIIVVFLLVFYNDSGLIKYINTDENVNEKQETIKKDENVEIEDETTIENEKLVLKSNYEEKREKLITYFFKENVLDEINIFEKYTDEETYIKERDRLSKRADIEVIKIDNEQLEIHYKKLRFGSDERLSYEQIYKKYMGIIGAYEVI